MAITEIVTLLKDVLLGGAAITGAFIANKGLTTWKRQHKGNSEYELSRRILVTLYKYRDAIDGVRHPAIWENEMPRPPEEKIKSMTVDEIRFYGTRMAIQARWDKVNVERTSLYADLLEAKALWDDEIIERFKVLFKLQQELFISFQNFIQLINPDLDEDTKEAVKNIKKNRRDIMYSDLSEEGDEYKKEFQKGVEEIEKYLNPKLRYSGVLTQTKRFNDKREVDKTNEHHVKLFKTTEYSAKALETTKQSFNFISTFIHFSVVFPRLKSVGLRWNHRNKSQIQGQLTRLIALIRPIHQ